MLNQLYALTFFNGQSEDSYPSTVIHGVSHDVEKLKNKAQTIHEEDWCEDGEWSDEVNCEIKWELGDCKKPEGYIDDEQLSYYIIEPVDNYDEE